MGLFDGTKSEQIKFLEDERKKSWDRIVRLEKITAELQKEVNKRASDYEREAASNSKKTAEYKNRTEQRLEEANLIIKQINEKLAESENLKNSLSQVNVEALDLREVLDTIFEHLEQQKLRYDEKLEGLNDQIDKFESFFDDYPELSTELQKVDDFVSKIEESVEKSNVSLIAINRRKKEIDDLHREIFGYEQNNYETDTIETIEGLKDELDNTYNELSISLEQSKKELNLIKQSYENNFIDFETSHKAKHNRIVSEIEGLLPRALTAGLSSAFSNKKEDEIKSSEELQKNFNIGIGLLSFISLIPVAVSITFLYQGVDIQDVIQRLPRLVLSIAPIYVPALWFTFSASKKLNLSKRLIEEYTHKEVLSRTYEGLSNQIDKIPDKIQSEELRVKLLSNFLQISSENPGKLISNYDSSDHPIMEALEQSYKFQIAIDKLEAIPGMGKVAAILETNSKKKLENKKTKVEKIMNTESDFNDEE